MHQVRKETQGDFGVKSDEKGKESAESGLIVNLSEMRQGMLESMVEERNTIYVKEDALQGMKQE